MMKKISIAGLILLLIALGFVRDHIFVSLNYAIKHGLDPSDRLFMFKWPLTILFCLLYLINTCALLYTLFGSKKSVQVAVFFYIFLLGVSLLAAVWGKLFSSFESMYPFIRTVMGIAQSPIVLMVLVPAFLLNEALAKNKG